jgi:hypothetical protein
MTVIDSKERALWPAGLRDFFMFGLHYVEDDGDTVFIVVSIKVCTFEWLTWRFLGLCLLRSQQHVRSSCLNTSQAENLTLVDKCFNRCVRAAPVLFTDRT